MKSKIENKERNSHNANPLLYQVETRDMGRSRLNSINSLRCLPILSSFFTEGNEDFAQISELGDCA